MKIDRIDNTSLLYKKYKNKRIEYYVINGIVVGYFFNKMNEVTLIVEMKHKDIPNNFKNFIEYQKISPIDYHGDSSKCFFFVRQSDFDRKSAYEIEL